MTTLFARTPGTFIECIKYMEHDGKEDIEINKSTITIHPICIDFFSKSSCAGDRNMSLKMKKPNFSTERTNSKCGAFTFAHTAITHNGVIITKNNYYLNGYCFQCVNAKYNKNKLLQYRNYLKNKTRTYNKVISISQLWGEGSWHFPIESLSALKNIKNFDNIYLHINKKNKFCLDWIKFLNIPIKEENIIEGDIFANILLVPEMNGCGSPKYNITKWLQNRVLNKLNLTNKQNLLILIKRNYTRTVINHDEILILCNKYCMQNNLKLYIHDDSNLPNLKTQMECFNKAKIVLGPHGAGGVNLLACKPNATFIEFLLTPEKHINSCYIKLVSQLDINYYGIPYNEFGVDIKILQKYLLH